MSAVLCVSAAGFAGDAKAAGRAPAVVGGSPVLISAYPWMAALDISTDVGLEAFCGGAVIGERWVLTAAHCLDLSDLGAQVTHVAVTLGRTNVVSGGGATITADRFAVNPGWDPDTLEGDFGLLRLSQPAPVRGIRLVSPSERGLYSAGTVATFPGWGLTATNGALASSLQAASLPILADGACGSPDLWGSLFDPATMLCVGVKAGTGSCQGDSGGPLLVPDGLGDWVEVGIDSWGSNVCGDPTLPDVFARLGTLVPAIVQVLQDDPVAPVAPPEVSTAATLARTAQTGTVTGTVVASGLASDYRVEYGPTASYGSTLGGYADDGATQVPLTVELPRLVPSTTYHYRFVAINAAGSAVGRDRTFTTEPLVTLGGLSKHNNVLLVPVTCNEPNDASCTGHLQVKESASGQLIATGTATLPALRGQHTTALLVKLTGATHKPLPAGSIAITATLTASGGGSHQTLTKRKTF